MSVNSLMTNLANAIRQKSGVTGSMGIEAMTAAVQSIETGGGDPVLQDKTVSPTESEQNVTADSGFDGLRRVTVNPIDPGFIGSGVARKSKSDIGVNRLNVTVPAGYYAQQETVTAAPNLQSKTITPSESQQTATPDGSYDALSSVVVGAIDSNYVGTGIARKSQSDVSVNGLSVTVPAGYYAQQSSVTATPKTQSKTVTPTESDINVAPDSGYDALSGVKVNAISTTYVGSGISRRTSTNVTASGATVAVPAGYYASQVTKSVTTGTAGTPSATKGTVSNNQITITPTVTNTTGYITGGTKNGTAVTVKASELVSGSQTATENKTYDVTNLAELVVNVAGGGGGLPSGISAIKYGEDTISSAFTTTRRTITHGMGVTPDLVFYWHDGNVATTYSMLWALRFSQLGHRSSAYDSFMAYHNNNSTTTVSLTNSNSTTYGVSNLTATTFQLASASSSYYWRAGTYKWIAIKFG